MKNILVSGTTGHLGYWISKAISVSHNVIELRRTTFDYEGTNRCITYQWLEKASVAELCKMLQNVDTFIHVASEIDISITNTNLTYFNLYLYHLILIKLKAIGIKKVILISSAPLVGYHGGALLTEEINVLPPSLYHFTKYGQEQITELVKFDFFYALRISSPISPKIKGKTIFPVFMENAINGKPLIILGKGTRMQNYIDARDISNLCSKLIKEELTSGIYNIVSDASISNLDLARTIIEEVSSNSELLLSGVDDRDDKPWEFDNSKAKEILGFNCKYSLRNTISDFWKEKLK